MLSALFGGVDRPLNAAQSVWGPWPGDESVLDPNHVRVDRVTSMQLAAVYGCVTLISDGVSTLPLDVHRRLPDGSKQEVATPRWLEDPTPHLNFVEWCGQLLSSLLLDGNAYIWVSRSPSGAILELDPLDPELVSVDREGGRKRIRVNGEYDPSAEIIHIKGRMWPGTDVGLSPIEYARRTIGLGLSALDFGADFFANEGNMPGVIEFPGAMEPQTRDDLARQWRKKRNRKNRGAPGVLWAGATYKPTGINHEQMQFLATRQYTAAEIAGQLFLIDPSDLGIPTNGSSLTYANLAERNKRRVQVGYLPWIIRLEHTISALLSRPRFAKFNVDGLLRADQASRYQSYATAIGSGFMLPDEARELEDWAPLPEPQGDMTDANEADAESDDSAAVDSET